MLGPFSQKLNPQEQQLFAKYGKLPTHKNVLMKMQKVRHSSQILCYFLNDVLQDRKYFDSGDYALSKAGVAPQNTVGTAIPNPEKCVSAIAQHRFFLTARLLVAFPTPQALEMVTTMAIKACLSHPLIR